MSQLYLGWISIRFAELIVLLTICNTMTVSVLLAYIFIIYIKCTAAVKLSMMSVAPTRVVVSGRYH